MFAFLSEESVNLLFLDNLDFLSWVRLPGDLALDHREFVVQVLWDFCLGRAVLFVKQDVGIEQKRCLILCLESLEWHDVKHGFSFDVRLGFLAGFTCFDRFDIVESFIDFLDGFLFEFGVFSLAVSHR